MDDIVTLTHQNVCKDGFTVTNTVDAGNFSCPNVWSRNQPTFNSLVLLDLPAPWDAVECAKKALQVSVLLHPSSSFLNQILQKKSDFWAQPSNSSNLPTAWCNLHGSSDNLSHLPGVLFQDWHCLVSSKYCLHPYSPLAMNCMFCFLPIIYWPNQCLQFYQWNKNDFQQVRVIPESQVLNMKHKHMTTSHCLAEPLSLVPL